VPRISDEIADTAAAARGDDKAIKGGLARIAAQHADRDTRKKIECFFGLAHPKATVRPFAV